LQGFHQVFHVIALVAFLMSLATAFVGFIAPLLFEDQAGLRVPALRSSLILLAAAGLGLAGDWLAHNVFR
jgi:hypothetical protein